MLVENQIENDFSINCTPGGQFYHIEQEILATKSIISKMIILVGTNNLRYGMQKGREAFNHLMQTIRRKCPKTQVGLVLNSFISHLYV